MCTCRERRLGEFAERASFIGPRRSLKWTVRVRDGTIR